MKRLFAFLCLLVALPAFSQVNYDASTIAAALSENANTVKRLEEMTFEVTDVDRASFKVHRVVTLLNKDAESELLYAEYTNKYRLLDECEIKVYDKFGIQTTKYKKKDLVKQATGEGLVDDGMYNYITIAAPSYPITIEYTYTIRYIGTLFYEAYRVQHSSQAVERSSYTLKVPRELGVRFKEQHIKLQPETTEDRKTLTYKWAVSNLPPFKNEPDDAIDADPAIIVAPNKFRLYNSSGNMKTWKDFGLWEKELTNGLDVLPEERKQFFANLVKDAAPEREKVALIYRYLQENFRYVSIQLGIGGYQPFAASFTDAKKYGDCKALSFYTYSVLKSIGIKSHIALINSAYNDEPVDPLFPQSAFNHVIICIPQAKDSIWLECTSKKADFNYLGSDTENRLALLITDEGGVLAPTPLSDPSANSLSVSTNILLNEDGSGKVVSMMTGKGDYHELMGDVLHSKNDDQKNFIVNQLGFNQPDDFLIKKTGADTIQIDMDIEKVPQFTAGPKMFLSPRVYRFWNRKMPNTQERKSDYYFYAAVQRTDTTVYQLPEGYVVDALPAPKEKKCSYARYFTSYQYDKDKARVVTTARIILYKNRIPADKYAEVKSFIDEVLADDGQKIVIKKN